MPLLSDESYVIGLITGEALIYPMLGFTIPRVHWFMTRYSLTERRARFPLYIVIALLLMTAAFPASAQDEVSDLLGRINNLRASVGRAGYTLNGALSAAAQSQAQWMVDTGTIAHARPDGSNPRSRAMNAGYPSAMVSENIYGGTNASAGVAWSFWINSPIHYAGLTSPNYTEVGIGIAGGGWGRAYVLVFGNPGGSWSQPAASGNSSGGGDSGVSAPQRIYAIGVDESGNIQHLIATGDTLGDIALIYGYTWDDIPGMMALNSLADARSLLPGEVFLVPPHGGTYTPTPGGPTNTPEFTATPLPPTITPFVAATATSPTIPTPMIVNGTVVVPPDVLATMRVSELPNAETHFPTAVEIEMTGTPAPSATPSGTPESQSVAQANPTVPAVITLPESGAPTSRSNSPNWLVIALLVQVGILAMAGFEFARRTFTRRRR